MGKYSTVKMSRKINSFCEQKKIKNKPKIPIRVSGTFNKGEQKSRVISPPQTKFLANHSAVRDKDHQTEKKHCT